MPKHTHDFIENYQGLVGFGLDRQTDEYTLAWYLQKFSDDELIKILMKRFSHEELESLFDQISGLMKKHLSKSEYHQYFLKE